MTPRIAELLDIERRKLSLLRNKVIDQEQRVKVLEQLANDPLDALLERELSLAAIPAPVSAPVQPSVLAVAAKVDETADKGKHEDQDQGYGAEPAPVEAPAAVFTWGATPRNPRRVPALWVQLLRYIGREGKTYDDVKLFVRDRGLQISEGAVRTQLMNYRKDFDFVENPQKGFYRATERALAFIDAQEGRAAPALPGGGAQSQPEPLARAAA